MVHKNSDYAHERRQTVDDLRSQRRFDASRALLVKIQTNRIRAKQHRVAGVFRTGYAADLDVRHKSSFTAISGSVAVKKCSPIKNASASAFSNFSISAEPCIPLSTTNNR